MKFTGLLIAVVVLAALGGAVYWSDKADKAKEKEPAKDAPPKILTIPDDQFKSIRLQKTGGDTIVVQKSDAPAQATRRRSGLGRIACVHTQLAHFRPADRR